MLTKKARYQKFLVTLKIVGPTGIVGIYNQALKENKKRVSKYTLDNQKRRNSRGVLNLFNESAYLTSTLYWEDTEEGYAYWRDIFKKINAWEEKLRKKAQKAKVEREINKFFDNLDNIAQTLGLKFLNASARFDTNFLAANKHRREGGFTSVPSYDHVGTGNYSDFLQGAFPWARTLEDNKYWRTIHEYMQREEGQNRG